jgi:hypothetical protein
MIRRCLDCGDELPPPSELSRQWEDAERCAANIEDADLASMVLTRATTRIDLQRAGFCLWHAVERRDLATEIGGCN